MQGGNVLRCVLSSAVVPRIEFNSGAVPKIVSVTTSTQGETVSGALDRRLLDTASAHLIRWSSFVGIALLIAVNLFVFRGVYFGNDSFPFDFPQAHYGFVAYWMSSLAHGELPHWIPYQGMGYAFASNLQSGLFYPGFWLVAISQVDYTLHVASAVQALHVLLGGVGAFLLARVLFGSSHVSFLVGLAFSLYGGFFTNSEHPDIVRAFALTPWLYWSLLFRNSGLAFSREAAVDETLLCRRNVLVPLVFYFFITGSYTGNLVATAFLLPFFLLAQCVQRIRGGKPAFAVVGSTGGLMLLLALGVLLASVYLVPAMALSQELTRATEAFSISSRWWLQVGDLWSLVFSSRTAVPVTVDYSMIGMQLPAPLFLFLPLVMRLHAKVLWPFALLTLLALLMSLQPFAGIPEALGKLFPPLGYSRFPAGDYRTTAVLGLLVFLGAGLHAAFRCGSPTRVGQWLAPSLGLALAIGGLNVLVRSSPDLHGIQAQVMTTQLAPMIPALVVLMLRLPSVNPSTATAVLGLCFVVSSVAALEDMNRFWRYPAAEQSLSRLSPIALWEAGKQPAGRPFERELAARPARIVDTNLPWRGYLTGDYLMGDKGGLVTTARRTVEMDRDLMAYMLSASRPLVLKCDDSTCSDALRAALRSSQAPGATAGNSARITTFRRNEVAYTIDATEPVLLVENEIFMPGWRGSIVGHQQEIEPVRLLGALRAWRVPAGATVLRLRYEPPHFPVSMAISLIALAVYGVLVGSLRWQHRWRDFAERWWPRKADDAKSSTAVETTV